MIKHLIFALVFVVLPVRVMAQSDGSAVPASTSSSPVEASSLIRTVSPSPTPISTPKSIPPSASSTPLINSGQALPTVSNDLLIGTVPDINSAENSWDWVSIAVVIGAVILGLLRINKIRNSHQKEKPDSGRCDSIKDLLEQKRKELEDFARNWPEEKLKSMAMDQISGQLKKDEDVKNIIETAESLKAKHDKLKETIEMLQKKYDLCMLELPSLKKAKDLKFKGFKAKFIMEGKKSSTIRLFDDKDLKSGDNLELIDSDDGKVFSKAEITEVIQKKLGDIDVVDLEGHEKWSNKEEMLGSLREYYGDKINLDTISKIVRFKLIK